MSKRIAIFCILALFVSNIYAQPKKWSMSLGLGVAAPVGKFGSKELSDSLSAFAKPGLALYFEASYKFSRYIGFTILLTGQQNEVDRKAIAGKLNETYPDYYFTFSSGDWNIGKIMGGLNTCLPIDNNKKLNFTARIMAGVLKTTAPKTSMYQVGFDNNTGLYNYAMVTMDKRPLDWTFAYLAGIGFKYDVEKNIFIQINGDYAASSPESYSSIFRGPTTLAILPNDPPVPIYPTGTTAHVPKQPLNSVNICFGIGVNF